MQDAIEEIKFLMKIQLFDEMLVRLFLEGEAELLSSEELTVVFLLHKRQFYLFVLHKCQFYLN